MSYAPNCLNDQIHVKKSVLTIKLAFVIRILGIDSSPRRKKDHALFDSLSGIMLQKATAHMARTLVQLIMATKQLQWQPMQSTSHITQKERGATDDPDRFSFPYHYLEIYESSAKVDYYKGEENVKTKWPDDIVNMH